MCFKETSLEVCFYITRVKGVAFMEIQVMYNFEEDSIRTGLYIISRKHTAVWVTECIEVSMLYISIVLNY